ncbi:MAG: metal-dependent transcriptional regulator [Deltaproteobacteria bacterium]|nr:metal-dependent transcriptional regulator [Deltaproteobacteria bacterium]
MTTLHDLREELLEHAWTLEEQEALSMKALLETVQAEGAEQEITRLKGEGLLKVDGERVELTPQGRTQARHVVRANRLASRLLTDLLELAPSLVESQACRLEHAISPLLADSLCTLLGHPPTAPDGAMIPRGACCESARTEITPAVHPLTELELGADGRITFIRPRFPERLSQLSSLGLIPGVSVRLTQRQPSVVLAMGESTLALDRDVARDIFVKPGRAQD